MVTSAVRRQWGVGDSKTLSDSHQPFMAKPRPATSVPGSQDMVRSLLPQWYLAPSVCRDLCDGSNPLPWGLSLGTLVSQYNCLNLYTVWFPLFAINFAGALHCAHTNTNKHAFHVALRSIVQAIRNVYSKFG